MEVAQYNFLAIPVVDSERRLLGIITVDDVIDVLIEENSEDILRFGAVERGSVDQPYFTVPLLRVLRNRFGWLLLLMVADTLTGAVLRQFSTRLAAVVQLSFYIPLLIGTGGNTGAQTVSTIIRGLAVRDIHFSDLWRVLRRELLGGLLLGLALSLVAGTRAWLWDGDLSPLAGHRLIDRHHLHLGQRDGLADPDAGKPLWRRRGRGLRANDLYSGGRQRPVHLSQHRRAVADRQPVTQAQRRPRPKSRLPLPDAFLTAACVSVSGPPPH